METVVSRAWQTQWDILEAVVDDQCLTTRLVFIGNKARPHLARQVVDFLHQNALTTIPWVAISSEINPIERLWNPSHLYFYFL